MTSKNSDSIYAEINLATREVQAEDNERYANFKSLTGETSPHKQDTNVITFPATKDESSKKCVLVLSLILALVVIGVAGGGVYLALELTQLKAAMIALQESNSTLPPNNSILVGQLNELRDLVIILNFFIILF